MSDPEMDMTCWKTTVWDARAQWMLTPLDPEENMTWCKTIFWESRAQRMWTLLDPEEEMTWSHREMRFLNCLVDLKNINVCLARQTKEGIMKVIAYACFIYTSKTLVNGIDSITHLIRLIKEEYFAFYS